MILSLGPSDSSDGWQVTRSAKTIALVVTIPTTIVGLVLSLSLWFLMVGAPLLVFGGASICGVLQANKSGVPHPALAIAILAATELTFGLLVLAAWPANDGRLFGTIFGIAGSITACVAWLVALGSTALSPPPPATSAVPSEDRPRNGRL